MTIVATEVNVYERKSTTGNVHYYQYDFRVTMPDGEIYRERRKARGATSESAARSIGVRRMQDVLRNGPKGRRGSQVPTVADFAPKWLAWGKSVGRQKWSTLHNKEVLLRNHLIPLIGNLRLNEITGKTLGKIAEDRAYLEPGSLNNVLKYVIAMMRAAHKVPDSGITSKLEIPEKPPLDTETESAWYTEDDIERLVASASTFNVAALVLILLAGDAGLRAGEISALRWTDVDFVAGELTVRSNLVRGHEGTPKNGESRTIPLSARLRRALVQLQAAEGGPRPCAPSRGWQQHDDRLATLDPSSRRNVRRNPGLRYARTPPWIRLTADEWGGGWKSRHAAPGAQEALHDRALRAQRRRAQPQRDRASDTRLGSPATTTNERTNERPHPAGLWALVRSFTRLEARSYAIGHGFFSDPTVIVGSMLVNLRMSTQSTPMSWISVSPESFMNSYPRLTKNGFFQVVMAKALNLRLAKA